MVINVGVLFQLKCVKFKLKKYEIFEFVDFVAAICFTNTNNQKVCTILNGPRNVEVAFMFGEELIEDKYYFNALSLSDAVKLADNRVDFSKIRTIIRAEMANKYHVIKNGELEEVTNKALISYLDSLKKEKTFSEGAFDGETDISKMYNSIKQTIISQDEQIMQILTALFKNQKVVDSNLDSDLIAKLKENIIIYGSTGTGKTEILKRISKLYKIPIVIEDATSLSEVGYTGRNVTDMLEDLYIAADRNLELAQKGILVIDEFDKLAEKDSEGTHVSRFGVQRSLLKILDGSEIYFNNIKFDTSKLTIVALGAFTGITSGDEYKNLTSDDFEKYGILRELIGRFSKTIAMKPLEKEDIIQILQKSDFSPLNTYKELFKMLKVDFTYNDEFVEYIAELAIAKNSGARSIKTVFDNEISSALFRIFAGEYSGISLVRPDDVNKEAYILTKAKK